MLLGRTVFVYRADDGFSKPIPGTIAAVHDEKTVDVNILNSGLSDFPPLLALAKVVFCENMAEASQALSDGAEAVCSPYDTNNPVAFVKPKTVAKATTKPKK